MASLIFHDDILNSTSNALLQTTLHTFHETRHFKSHLKNKTRHHNFAETVSNSILDIVNDKYIPVNSVLPDMELLSNHIDISHLESAHYPGAKFNITMNRSEFILLGRDGNSVLRHETVLMTLYCIAYVLVFLLGLIGNCFVIAVVFRSPRMRTVTNFFIVNLAFADILVVLFCLPATLMSNIFLPWVLGWWMCKTVPYIQGVSVAASVYSLVAVSVDRFLAIWWPLKCQITKKRARIMIVTIWFIAISLTIPWAVFFDLVVIYDDMPHVKLCLDVWPNRSSETIYFLVGNLILCYVLPMVIISLCYIMIWIKVSRRSIPSDTKDAQMERLQQKSKVKVIKMLVAVIILFVLSWLPLYVIFARIKLGGELHIWEVKMLEMVTPVAQWLGSSNSCINPILYAFFNKKFRRGFVAIIKSRKCCGRLRYYETIALMSSSTSTRKSSHYHNNNNNNTSITRRSPPAPYDKTAVSFIFSNTGV